MTFMLARFELISSEKKERMLTLDDHHYQGNGKHRKLKDPLLNRTQVRARPSSESSGDLL